MSRPLYRVVLFLFGGPNRKSGNGQCCDCGNVTGVERSRGIRAASGLVMISGIGVSGWVWSGRWMVDGA